MGKVSFGNPDSLAIAHSVLANRFSGKLKPGMYDQTIISLQVKLSAFNHFLPQHGFYRLKCTLMSSYVDQPLPQRSTTSINRIRVLPPLRRCPGVKINSGNAHENLIQRSQKCYVTLWEVLKCRKVLLVLLAF